MIRFAILPGDGIGPEVLEGPRALLQQLSARARLRVTGPWPVGASAWVELGEGLPKRTLEACEEADVILFGAVGVYPGLEAEGYRTEQALLDLREHFDLSVSIRRIWRGDEAPLTVVRNLLGGAYGGRDSRDESEAGGPATDRVSLSPRQIEQVVEMALPDLDNGRQLWSVDKANLLATSRLWRQVVDRVAKERGIACRHLYVDRCAFELARHPLPAAVIVTEGLFGDILTDLAAARAGSMALCSSASLHPGKPLRGRCMGLFEPLHGSAPRLVGKAMANPAATFYVKY